MEDQLSQQVVENQTETLQPEIVSAHPAKPSYLLPVLLTFLITTVVLVGIYFGFLTKKSTLITASPTPSPSPSLSPSIDPITNWQVYQNTKFNFSFKYPRDFKLYDSIDQVGDRLIIQNFSTEIGRTIQPTDYQMIIALGLNEGRKLDWYTTNASKELGSFPIEQLSIGGLNALKGQSGQKQVSVPTIWVINGEYTYTIQLPTSLPESEKTFDQILSTFAFSGNKISESNMIHYVLKDKVSTIDYPKGWKIIDNTKQIDLYEDGKPQWSQDIELTLNDYKISSRNPLAWGPTACIFPDSPEYKKGDVYGEEYSSFTEFSNSKLTYRRSITSKPESEKQTWIICSKSTGGRYGGVSGFGASSYITPQSYDESTLSAMDDILMSMTNNIK